MIPLESIMPTKASKSALSTLPGHWFVEIELQSSAGRIVGDLKQKVSVNSDKLNYYWNICFERPGNYEIRFILRWLNPFHEDITKQIATDMTVIDRTIIVSQAGIFGSNLLRIAAYISGIAAFILVILQILQILGYIAKTD